MCILDLPKKLEDSRAGKVKVGNILGRKHVAGAGGVEESE